MKTVEIICNQAEILMRRTSTELAVFTTAVITYNNNSGKQEKEKVGRRGGTCITTANQTNKFKTTKGNRNKVANACSLAAEGATKEER